MGLVFAVQVSIGSMVSVLAWLIHGWPAALSAFGAVGVTVLPNLALLWMLGRIASDWRPIGLLAGKLLGLLVSVVGLVWWSQSWSGFHWLWALTSLTVVLVAWLFAPMVLARSERRMTDKRIDEIVALSERSTKD